VPGSHHAQFIDVLHRQHAIVEDGVRAAKSMGLRNLPSKTWQVNCGWVLAAGIAADLTAWCRLLGLHDQHDLKDAEPDTLRYRLLSLPARLVRHARARVLKISRTWPWKDAFLACSLAAAVRPAGTRLTSHPRPRNPERRPPGAVGTGAPRANRAAPPPASQIPPPKTGTTRSVTDLAGTLNHRGWC
jgi:Transposase DDE domain group 1